MEKVDFEIINIDPLGQGVFKDKDRVFFIAKTLPEEIGTALITKNKGNISFGYLENKNMLTKHSVDRIEPTCPHYDKCSSCDFLHTSYECEIDLKIKTLSSLISTLKLDNRSTEIQVIKSNKRLNYRNRIQLHYDTRQNKIGYISKITNSIIEVPKCCLPNEFIKEKLGSLYQDNSWQKLIKSSKNSGHIELYYLNNKVKININQRYSFGGFSQVNNQMNKELKKIVSTEIINNVDSNKIILDLFGGDGNLSELLTNFNVTVVDKYSKNCPESKKRKFFNIDLHKSNSPDLIMNCIQKEIGAIIIDPPRSGFKQFGRLLDYTNAEQVIYVSCNLSTLIRDINSINDRYYIQKIFMLDLVPATHHLETVFFLDSRR